MKREFDNRISELSRGSMTAFGQGVETNISICPPIKAVEATVQVPPKSKFDTENKHPE